MKILFLSQVFPDDSAPVRGTFNLALCQALSEEHKVRVIAPRPWTETLPRTLRRQGSLRGDEILARTTLTASYPTFWYLPKVALHHTAGAMAHGVHTAVQEVTRDFQPDVVLSYWADPEGVVGLRVANQLGVPAACIVGGTDVLILPHRSPRRLEQVRGVLQNSDAIITVSDGLRHACHDLGAPRDRVRTIYQGIDQRQFSPRDRLEARKRLKIPQGVNAFVWVGRIVGLKRLDLLLEATSILHRAGGRLKLFVLGDGPQRAAMEAYAETLGVSTAVDFVGPVLPSDLADWYSAADATVLSSDSEGLPNVLRESLACGTPFVSTEVGSVSELAQPNFSRLVAKGNAGDLANAMAEITDSKYRVAAGLYRSRTWQECATEIAGWLHQLTRGKSVARSRSTAEAPRDVMDLLRASSPPLAAQPAAGTAANQSADVMNRRQESAPSVDNNPVDDFMAALNQSLVPSGPAGRRRS
ncbi:MAG: glycosyltransferase [Planctomycetaceae bacterium]